MTTAPTAASATSKRVLQHKTANCSSCALAVGGAHACCTLPPPGDCLCYPGYSTSNLYGEVGESGDCGHSITPITSCPGEIECSGHGNCADHPTYRCECEEGWQGGDCSERKKQRVLSLTWCTHESSHFVLFHPCDRQAPAPLIAPGLTTPLPPTSHMPTPSAPTVACATAPRESACARQALLALPANEVRGVESTHPLSPTHPRHVNV